MHAAPSAREYCVRELDLPPDPLALARRLVAAGGEQVMLLHAAEQQQRELPTVVGEPGRHSFIAAWPDRCSRRLDPLQDDEALPLAAGAERLSGADRQAAGAPRWIGVVPYECRRGLERDSWCEPDGRPPPFVRRPQWWRFGAAICVDHGCGGRVSVVGDDASAMERLASSLHGVSPGVSDEAGPGVDLQLNDEEPAERHIGRVRRAIELIEQGDLYQVNVARRVGVRLRGGTPFGLYERLVRAAPTPYAAMLHLADDTTVLSTSPELLLCARARVDPTRGSPGLGWLVTEPIKGTRPRGRDGEDDRRLARELAADPKERAELAMIIDVERNDLSRVCRVGSVRLVRAPRVVTHRTIHHRQACIMGHARADASRRDVLAALLPSGSVTGAPKVRAMEVIRELEAERRGLYTGGIGTVSNDGTVTLSMAIRTLVLRGGDGVYWTGGGIVADSDPEMELRETRWKAAQLQRAAG